MSKKDETTRLLYGVPIFGGTHKQLLDSIIGHVEKNTAKNLMTICTPNPEQFVLAWEREDFAHTLRESTWNIPDGQGIAWALNRQTGKTPGRIQRIPGRKLFHELLQYAAEQNWKVFLLGGRSGSAQTIIETWKEMHGTALPWAYDDGAVEIGKERDDERARVLKKIRAHAPTLLFIAYGAPHQELWMMHNREALQDAGVRVAMVVGGSFEYEAGKMPRVPKMFETLHIEWLWRLINEPWRWRRQLKGLRFFLRVLFSGM